MPLRRRGAVDNADDGGNDVTQVGGQAHEGLSRRPERVGDGHFGVPHSLSEQVEGQHLCVVVVVGHLGDRGRFPRQRSVSGLAVGDSGPGYGPQGRRQDAVADLAVDEHPSVVSQKPRANHVISMTAQHGSDQVSQFFWGIFPVRVAECDGGGVVGHCIGKAGPDACAEAAVAWEPDDLSAGGTGHRGGVIA